MWYRSPEVGSGTGGDTNAGGVGSGSLPAGSRDVSPPSPQTGGGEGAAGSPSTDPFAVVAGQKPQGLAEKFWNAELKQIRLPELMRSYAEAESLIGRRVEQMKSEDFQRLVDVRVGTMTKELEAKALQNIRGQAPTNPTDYALQLSSDAMRQLPQTMHDTAQFEGDPLVGWFRNFAHEAGLGQGQFQQAFEGYLSTLAQAQQMSIASERSKLGENGERRMAHLSSWLDGNLEARQAQALKASLGSAEAFAAVESLVKKFADPSLIRGFSDAGDLGRTGPGLSTEAEIRQAQRDPRYWDPARRDPGYVKAIDGAWSRLFGRNNGAGPQ